MVAKKKTMQHIPHRATRVKQYKTLANANRLLLLEALAKHAQSVTQLIEITGLTQQITSNHLARMRRDGIVKAMQAGTLMIYSIKDPFIKQLITQ